MRSLESIGEAPSGRGVHLTTGEPTKSRRPGRSPKGPEPQISFDDHEIYQALLRSLDCVFLCDFEGRLLDANQSALGLIGRERDGIPSLSLSSLLDEDQLVLALRDLAELKATGVQRNSTEFRLRRPNGEPVLLETRASVVLKDGQPWAVLGVGRDISARKRAEENYRSLFRTMLDGFAVHEIICDEDGNPIDYRFLAVNPAFERMTGLKAKDVVGRTVLEVLPGTERHWIETYGRVAITGEPTSFENHHIGLGKVFDVTAYRPAANQFACVFTDVTDRRRGEEALRASEARLRSYVDSAGDAIFVIDAESGRIRDCNPRACHGLGYTRSELKKLRTRDIEARLTAEEIDAINQALKSDGVTTIEGAHRRKDGSVFPVEISSSLLAPDQPGHILAIVRDVTKSKRAEEALKQSEERHRLLADNASDVIWTMDTEGHFTYVSPSVEKLRGYSVTEVMQQSLHEALTPASAALAEAAIQEAMSATQAGRSCPEFRGELEQPCKDGSTVWTDATVSGMRDAAGRFSGFLGVTRDITERRQSREALKESEEQLRQAQKMEAIGQLAGGIAHDFNNLLTAIIGFSDLILASGDNDAEALRADVKEIKTAADRASALTSQILAFSRRQTLRPEVVSLNDIVADTERLLRRTLGEDMDLAVLECPDLGLVEADTSQFEQVLVNLALNARDAMKQGGKLTLETANVELGQDYCRVHPGVKPGSYVMLAVSDTGMGMDAETSSRAFEPFFTTKEPGKGTGLGLSTVYGIVKQSGGNIFLYSEPDRGTTFKIYLPRADKPRARARSAARAMPAPVKGREAVLVVEDEKAVRTLVARVLSSLGYEVTTACSGDEARTLLADGDAYFDLLLTDVILPGGLQGNDLAREAKTLRPDMPVLFMSGYTRDAIVHSGRLDAGVNYLEKPFTPDSLCTKVREVLDSSGVGRKGTQLED